jgi:aspartate kinase
MKSHTGVAGKLFETLANEGVNIDMISTSEIKISVVIDLAKGEAATNAHVDSTIMSDALQTTRPNR